MSLFGNEFPIDYPFRKIHKLECFLGQECVLWSNQTGNLWSEFDCNLHFDYFILPKPSPKKRHFIFKTYQAQTEKIFPTIRLFSANTTCYLPF